MEFPHEPNGVEAIPNGTLQRARQGSAAALGELLESFRSYLLLIANTEIGGELRKKVGASDLVQETLIRAQQGFVHFEGSTEGEFRAWLRQIMLNHFRNIRTAYLETHKRKLDREVSLDGSGADAVTLSFDGETPSRNAIAGEEELQLLQELARLPDDYQTAIRLRNWENLSFEEIGVRMGRSAEASRKLWFRALQRLGSQWENSDDDAASGRAQ